MDLAAWDQQLFTLLHLPLLDLLGEPVWRWLTSLALPLTLLLVTSAWGWHARRPLLPVGIALATGLLAEQLSSRVLKPFVGRPRPCSVEDLSSLACTGGLSMPSSHAISICAGIGVLWFLYPKLRPLYLLGAGLFILSRLALGVHYPGDLLVGSLLGCAISWSVGKRLLRTPWARP
ncbi:MAG TPA: hypothetical protein DEB46_03925 [Myxococcales bacterium]|nr:hypothetical protein [Myxococcales bacterium]